MEKNIFIQDRGTGIGGDAAMLLAETVARKHWCTLTVLFFFFFTSIKLLDTFLERALPATGAI